MEGLRVPERSPSFFMGLITVRELSPPLAELKHRSLLCQNSYCTTPHGHLYGKRHLQAALFQQALEMKKGQDTCTEKKSRALLNKWLFIRSYSKNIYSLIHWQLLHGRQRYTHWIQSFSRVKARRATTKRCNITPPAISMCSLCWNILIVVYLKWSINPRRTHKREKAMGLPR